MSEITEQIQMWLAHYGLSLAGALTILVLGWIGARLATSLIRRIMRRAKLDDTLVSFGGNLIHIGLLAIVIIAALNQVGFQTASLIAVLGAAGLALGLSLQGHISSLAAGILILIFRPFKLGDFVEAGGAMGTVEHISIMNTRITMPDNRAVIMPNTRIFSDKIINYSRNPIRRIDLVFGIGYGDDLKKAKQLLEEIMRADPRVLEDPAPRVYVVELADSSVNLAARPWVKREDFWDTRCELTEKVKLVFDEQGISIPYPQTDVHLFKEETAAADG